MTNIPLNVKIDPMLKKEAQQIAKNLGIPLTTIVSAYLREFTRTKEVRFSMEPTLRPEIGKLLKAQSKDFDEGRNVSGPFETAEELFAHLDSVE
jgi:addiction module RelB/DinJ family antitoxin